MQSHHPINHRVVARRLMTLGLGSALAALPLLSSTHAALAAPVASASPTKALAPHVAGEVLVRFTSSTSSSAQSKLLAQVGGKVTRRFSTGWMLVKVPSTEKALATLQSRKEVAAVQANLIIAAPQEAGGDGENEDVTPGRTTAAKTTQASSSKAPNDPYYPKQWALQKINAPEAWKTTTGSDDVIVAVVGTPIVVTHKDLAANIWTNTKEIPGNGKDDDGNGYIDDVHGWNGLTNSNDLSTSFGNTTRQAGYIGAVGNNGLGVTGLNWHVKMMSVASISDKFTFYNSAGTIGALDYILGVRKHGTNVRAVFLQLNVNTLGPYAEADSFKALDKAGVLVIQGAYDNGSNLDVKATPQQQLHLTNMMIVGGSDADDNRTAITNYGQKTVDIFAPGRNNYTTDNASDTAVGIFGDTGVSAAYVTGAAALLWSTQPGLSASAVKSRIINSATRVEKLRPYVRDGRRLNVGALINNAVHSIRGTVTGPVKGRTGNIPLAGVSLYLDSNTTPSTVTDYAGKYIISSVTGGKHTVKAVLSGLIFPAASTVNLPTDKAAPPTSVTLNIAAKTQSDKLYAITGTTTQIAPGPSTVALADVDIFVNDNPKPIARSDTKGNFSITNLPAGSYLVRAVNSKTGEAAPDVRYAYLPTAAEDGNSIINFVFPVAPDRIPPLLGGTNIPTKDSYTVADAPKTFEGTVSDASGVNTVTAFVYRYKVNDDGTVTSQTYDPATKKWVPEDEGPTYATIYGKDQTNPKSFNWKFTFPTYEPGYVYGMAVDADDIFGNQTLFYGPDELYIEFAVTANATPNAASPGSSSSPSAKDS